MSKISISRIFTVLLVLYPVIYVYDSPIGSLCLADTLLIIFYPFLFLKLFLIKRVKYDKLQLFLAGFVAANLVIVPILGISGMAEILRNQGHFLLVVFTLAVFVPNLFDKELGIKLLCYVSVVSSVYLMIQVVLLHGCGVALGAHLPFLTANISENGHIRPFAFFSEPAGFGTYNAIGLATLISLKPFKGKMNRIAEMLVSLGMLLSLSSTAVALLIIAWGCHIAPKLKKKRLFSRIKPITLFAILGVIVLFVVANNRMDIVGFIYQHVAPTSNGTMAAGVTGRIGNITNLGQDYSFTMSEIVLGHGMIDLVFFLPGLVRIYLYFGVMGCIVIALYFILLYKKSGHYGRLLIIIVIANSMFGDFIFGLAMFGYMQYIMKSFQLKQPYLKQNVDDEITNVIEK